MAEPLTHLACCVTSQVAKSICFLSGCPNASIQNMVAERHSIASRLIIKTLNKGDFGGNIIITDIGNEARIAQRSLVLPAHVANTILPQSFHDSFYQILKKINCNLFLDQISYCRQWPPK